MILFHKIEALLKKNEIYMYCLEHPVFLIKWPVKRSNPQLKLPKISGKNAGKVAAASPKAMILYCCRHDGFDDRWISRGMQCHISQSSRTRIVFDPILIGMWNWEEMGRPERLKCVGSMTWMKKSWTVDLCLHLKWNPKNICRLSCFQLFSLYE